MRKSIYIMATTVFAASASMVAAMEYDTDKYDPDNSLSGANLTSVPESEDSLGTGSTIVVNAASVKYRQTSWDYSGYTNPLLRKREEEAKEKARKDAADRLAWEKQKARDVGTAEIIAPTLLSPLVEPGTRISVGDTKVGLRKTTSGVRLYEPGSPTKGMKSPASGQGRKVATPPDTTRGITTSNDFGHEEK